MKIEELVERLEHLTEERDGLLKFLRASSDYAMSNKPLNMEVRYSPNNPYYTMGICLPYNMLRGAVEWRVEECAVELTRLHALKEKAERAMVEQGDDEK